MSENVIQASFAVGELSPSLLARVDFAKYRSGAATMRNFFVDYRSGASSRPGTEFICPAYGSWTTTNRIRLVRFQQSITVTYVLEFGNGYLRFISNGGSVVEPAFGISSIVQGTSTTLTIPGSVYAPGNSLFISGANGMPQINDRFFYIVNGGNGTYQIVDALTAVAVDSTNWGTYLGGGIAQRVYTISTPYGVADLPMLKFSQKANTMNITHPNHPPYVLTFTSATNWTLVPATIGATVGTPTITSTSSSGTGPVYYKYAVTAVDAQNQEGQPSNVGIMTGVIDLRSTAGSNQINFSGPTTGTAPLYYNVYGSSASYFALGADTGGLGFVGTNDTGSFIDSNISADFSQTPPVHQNPFAGVNPQVSSYFQQRLVYANGGGNLAQTFWTSKVGAPYNFDISNPSQADDAITADLVSLEVNEVKSLVPMPSGLIALTSKGVWQISGGAGGVATQGGPISPSTVTATPQAYIGASDVPPILINYDIVYVQALGSIVRDLTYNIYANIYTGNDISILSNHFFYDHKILEWAYAEEPFKIVWAVREDGVLLSLTMLKEQDMYG